MFTVLGVFVYVSITKIMRIFVPICTMLRSTNLYVDGLSNISIYLILRLVVHPWIICRLFTITVFCKIFETVFKKK